jgi:hypothetical protein
MESPVFLIGAERSGTTLLRLMLDGHPEIACPCAFDFALAWPEARNGELPEPIDYWQMLAEDRRAREARVVIDARLRVPELVRSLLAQLGRRTHKPVFAVTAHHEYERLLRLWPEARFLYVVRDGRDVARSHVALGWAGNVWAAAPAWRAAEREWRRVSALIPRENRLEVRFEDLVRDPRAELSRIAGFLGLEYAPGMLDSPARGSYAAPHPNASERWREQLSTRELALLEREIGPELRARGYAPSLVAPAWIPAPRRLALRLGDRAGRFRFRARQLGARWWARQRLRRRLNLAAFARTVALQAR